MEREGHWMLLIAGVLLSVNMYTFPQFPSFSLVSAYLLVRHYSSDILFFKRMGSRITLFLFLMSISILSLHSLLANILLPIFNAAGILICFLIIINGFKEFKKRIHLFAIVVVLYPFIYISLIIAFYVPFIAPTLIGIPISATLLYVMKNKRGDETDSNGNKDFQTDKEDLRLFGSYLLGGLLLTACIYILFSVKDMRYVMALFYDLIPSIVLSVWGATLIALSSKHRIADGGYVVFGAMLLLFFFLYFSRSFSFLSLESVIGTIRIISGISFTLILLGYDTRRIPREGIIEYGIYGMSFIPLVSSLVFVTPYISHPHIAIIFTLLILLKIIFTTGYVYKRIGIE